MDLCEVCGSPAVASQVNRNARCENHLAARPPTEFAGMSPGKLLSVVQDEERHEARVGDLALSPTLCSVTLAGQEYQLRHPASLIGLLGIPVAYLRSLPVELRMGLIDHEVARRQSQELELLTIGGTLHRFRPRGEQPMLTVKGTLEAAFGVFEEKGAMSDSVVESFSVNSEMSVYMLSKERRGMSRNSSDVIAAGVHLHVNGEAKAESYVRRLVCTNGMIRTERKGTTDAVAFREQVASALDYSTNRFLGKVAKSDAVVVPEPQRAVNRIIRDRRLDVDTRAEIRRRLAAVRDRVVSTWDLTNLITGAHHTHPAASLRLFAHGGEVARRFAEDSRCGSCGRW